MYYLTFGEEFPMIVHITIVEKMNRTVAGIVYIAVVILMHK